MLKNVIVFRTFPEHAGQFHEHDQERMKQYIVDKINEIDDIGFHVGVILEQDEQQPDMTNVIFFEVPYDHAMSIGDRYEFVHF